MHTRRQHTHNPVTLIFDILISGSVHAVVLPKYMRTKFGVDSSSRFPFTARTFDIRLHTLKIFNLQL